ncbi:carbohydrate ABC transporter permease [Diplocloster agilis]|uniref:carbohydrate ABC transporter permease n=1 Tax=Diplocloster agilis TaxID=2850323 RepID=UPI0008233D94|nr:sugar ABC transporter permease [Suonthocola fibrivorans]MCU6732339.1 sugar ABC transporter permease [Suonthocola fibrivorans]SCI43818.1 sn-glycerol-3-phosphate transport system permease protein ugpA [uncultured Clostridium sp.]
MKKQKTALLVLPALLISLSVVLFPGILTVLTSFTDFNGLSFDFNFIGLKNFQELFADRFFRLSFRNNFVWSCTYMIVPVGIALLISYLLCRRQRGRNVYQVLFLIPYVLAPITNAIIWMNAIYSPVTGFVSILKSWGLPLTSPLSSIQGALFGVAAVDIWHYWGFLMVVFLAAFRQTPQDQVEVAMVEGCNGWQMFRYVYFPSMLPTFRLMFIMVLIFSFQSFDYIWLMTGGGPAHATELLSTYSYRFAFKMFQFGKAASVALFMCIFGLIASCIYVCLSKKENMV